MCQFGRFQLSSHNELTEGFSVLFVLNALHLALTLRTVSETSSSKPRWHIYATCSRLSHLRKPQVTSPRSPTRELPYTLFISHIIHDGCCTAGSLPSSSHASCFTYNRSTGRGWVLPAIPTHLPGRQVPLLSLELSVRLASPSTLTREATRIV